MEYDVIAWGREMSWNELNDILRKMAVILFTNLRSCSIQNAVDEYFWVYFYPFHLLLIDYHEKLRTIVIIYVSIRKPFLKHLFRFSQDELSSCFKKSTSDHPTPLSFMYLIFWFRLALIKRLVYFMRKKLTLNHNASCLQDNIFCFRRIIKGSGRGKYRRLSRTKGRVMTTD